MDLTYGPEYEAFRDEVRAFLKAHKTDVPVEVNFDGVSPDVGTWQERLVQAGYTARTIPKAYGGAGCEPDLLKSRIIAEEFIKAGAPMGLANQGISMLVPTLLEHGTDEQKEAWIAKTIRGETVWCQGYSEPNSGSDLASLSTRATEDGNDFIINGQKIWTSTAHIAQMMFCLVRTEPDAPKHAGISYVLIPMDTPGIEVRPLKTMTGHNEFNEVFFTDVRVPQKNVVGQRGAGWLVANSTLKHERGMLGAHDEAERRLTQLGAIMQRETVDGERLIDNPGYRQRYGDLRAQALAMRCHGLRLMTIYAKNEPAGMAGLIVKLRGCELNHQVAGLAIDVLGEFGTLYGQDDEDGREAHAWQRRHMFDLGLIIGGGTAQIQKNIISERGLGMMRWKGKR